MAWSVLSSSAILAFRSLMFSILLPGRDSPLGSLCLSHCTLLYQLQKIRLASISCPGSNFLLSFVDALRSVTPSTSSTGWLTVMVSLSPVFWIKLSLLHISTWCLQLSTSLPSSILTSLFLSQSPHLSAFFHHPPGWSIKTWRTPTSIFNTSAIREYHFFSPSPLPPPQSWLNHIFGPQLTLQIPPSFCSCLHDINFTAASCCYLVVK